MASFTSPGGRFKAEAVTLKFLVEWAYGVQPFQHSDGPSWIGSGRYDIAAKAEGNPTEEQMKRMVQTLLDERFHLMLRREQKKLPAYVISVGKTPPKLVPAKEGGTFAMRATPVMGVDQKIAAYRIVGTRFRVVQLLDVFGRHMGRVMVNETGLEGEYDFTLDLVPDETLPNPMDPSMLLTGMRDQLGLTVKAQDTQVEYLAIESAEKVVAGN
jgi:uncharacterized protein (TIGR03435 family)